MPVPDPLLDPEFGRVDPRGLRAPGPDPIYDLLDPNHPELNSMSRLFDPADPKAKVSMLGSLPTFRRAKKNKKLPLLGPVPVLPKAKAEVSTLAPLYWVPATSVVVGPEGYEVTPLHPSHPAQDPVQWLSAASVVVGPEGYEVTPLHPSHPAQDPVQWLSAASVVVGPEGYEVTPLHGCPAQDPVQWLSAVNAVLGPGGYEVTPLHGSCPAQDPVQSLPPLVTNLNTPAAVFPKKSLRRMVAMSNMCSELNSTIQSEQAMYSYFDKCMPLSPLNT